MSDTLEEIIADVEKRLYHLRVAHNRRERGVPCPDLQAHVLRTEQVVFCILPPWLDQLLTSYGLRNQGGYQLHQCLACDEYIVGGYTGELGGIVPEDIGKRLIACDLSTPAGTT